MGSWGAKKLRYASGKSAVFTLKTSELSIWYLIRLFVYQVCVVSSLCKSVVADGK